MAAYVIDCCSFLNLYTGWRGIGELATLPHQWHVCDAVAKESQYVRDYDADGNIGVVTLDMPALIAVAGILTVQPSSEQELEDYVSFAVEVDDGEAQGLAIAKGRGYAFLTDDGKAGKLAHESGVQVISTANILSMWATMTEGNKARLPEILQRIEVLARFTPRKGSTDSTWWKAHS